MNPDDNDDLQIVTPEEADQEPGTMSSLSAYIAQNIAAFVGNLSETLLATNRYSPDLVAQCASAYTQELMRYWTGRADKDDPLFYEFTEE